MKRMMTGLALLAFGLASGLSSAQAGEVHVLNWKGYGTDEPWAVEAFEQKTGHKVVHDYFNSEQEMLTKLRTNPGTYDVVLINSAYTQQAAEEGLIQAIDTSGMANVSDLAPNLRENGELMADGKTYGVAWVWGVTSIAVDSKDVDPVPDSLQILWDEQYKGRIGWRDDALEAVQFAALATGQNINDIQDMDAVRDKLVALSKQIRTFWSSENEWNQFLASNEFDMAPYWSGSASRAKTHFKLPVEFVIAKEGAIGWLDGLSLVTDAPNAEGGKAFIDWMIDPDFYVEWDTSVGAPASANAKAAAALPAEAFNRAVLGDPEKVARVQFMAPVSEEKRQTYLELWQKVKTGIQ